MASDETPRPGEPATKYLFDLSFDEEFGDQDETDVVEDAEPEIPPPPPEPTFSEAELNAARADAFREGHAAGLNEAGAGIEQRMTTALDLIAAKIADLSTDQDAANRQALKDLIALNRRILEMLIPAYVERHGIDEVDALVADCLQRILDPGTVVIDVPAETAEALDGRLRETAARVGFAGELDIRPASDLGTSDVRLSWQNGGAARQIDEVWSEISEAVGRTLHSLEPDDAPASEPGAETAAAEPAAPPENEGGDGEPATAQPAEAEPADAGDAEPSNPNTASPDAQAELGVR